MFAAQAFRGDDHDLIVDGHVKSMQNLLGELLQMERRDFTAENQPAALPFDADRLAMVVKVGTRFQALPSE